MRILLIAVCALLRIEGSGCSSSRHVGPVGPKQNTLYYERAVMDQQDRRIERIDKSIESLEKKIKELQEETPTRFQVERAIQDLQSRVSALEPMARPAKRASRKRENFPSLRSPPPAHSFGAFGGQVFRRLPDEGRLKVEMVTLPGYFTLPTQYYGPAPASSRFDLPSSELVRFEVGGRGPMFRCGG